MSRVERLKEKKSYRRKYVGLAVLFFSVVFAGICAADYSVNSLMTNQKCIKIISFRNYAESSFEISIMDKKVHFNTKYIEKDIKNIKNKISGLMNIK